MTAPPQSTVLESSTRLSSNRPLRIAFITPGGTASRGGMGRMAHYLLQELRRREPGIRVRVLDSYGPGRAWRWPGHFFICALRLAVLCLARRVDVVHLNLAAHGSTVRKLLLMHLARLCRVPTLLHIHASKFIPFCEALSPAARRRLVRSLSQSSCIVVIGEYWRRYLVETLGVPGSLVTVIYNAVPLAAPSSRQRPHGPCRILALGQLGARKGTPELLEALASPALRALDWQAVIAGDGAVDASRARAAELGLGERLSLPGWVDASTVRTLLASADIFTLPSHNEGLPVAVLEAMAAALPVVTTPVGAIPELVTAEETGLLVPPGAAAPLAAALARLVTSPDLRARLGHQARLWVETHFRIEVTSERFASIYRALGSTCRVAADPAMISSNRSR